MNNCTCYGCKQRFGKTTDGMVVAVEFAIKRVDDIDALLHRNVIGDFDGVGIKLGVSKENISHQTATQTYWEQTDETKKKLDDYFESIGTNIEELSVSHSARALASAKYVQNWAANYEYKGLKSFVTTPDLF